MKSHSIPKPLFIYFLLFYFNKLSSSVNESEPPSILTYINLDVSKKQSTTEYDYEKVSNYEMFNAKYGYFFKKVLNSEELKWSSDNTKYCRGVIITEDQNGTQNFTYRIIKSDQITSYLSKISRESSKPSLKPTPSDKVPTITRDYTVSISPSTIRDTKTDGITTSTTPFFSQPSTSPSLHLAPSQTTSKNSLPLKPKLPSSPPVSPGITQTLPFITYIEIDLSKKGATDYYNYDKVDNLEIFDPKFGYLFSKVINGSEKIWETDGSKHVTIVTVDNSGPNVEIKFKTIEKEDQLCRFQSRASRSAPDTVTPSSNESFQTKVSHKTQSVSYENEIEKYSEDISIKETTMEPTYEISPSSSVNYSSTVNSDQQETLKEKLTETPKVELTSSVFIESRPLIPCGEKASEPTESEDSVSPNRYLRQSPTLHPEGSAIKPGKGSKGKIFYYLIPAIVLYVLMVVVIFYKRKISYQHF